MKKQHGSIQNSHSKKVVCTISAAALMLGVSSAATVGLHFQDNYCSYPNYSGYVVSLTAFGIPPSSWENLLPMNTGYNDCGGPLGYNLSELIDSTTSTNGLNPLPNGSLSLNWFGPTANYDTFGGYAGSPPYYDHSGGETGAAMIATNPISGEEQIYSSFIRDGVNFGPGEASGGLPSGQNNQPGYLVDITGLKSLFTNSPYVVELMASGDSIQVLTNAWVIDVTNAVTNSVSYLNIPPVANIEGTTFYQGTGGGLSTATAAINADHIQIMSAPPEHFASGTNHAGTISGFIITDKPLVSMYPQSIPLAGPGDSITLNPYAIGVPPLSYQWQLNGVNIPGATNLSYIISNFTLTAAGSYDLVVTNLYGTATSKVSTVTADIISQAPITTNDIVFDSNPTNAQNDGVDMGATWVASSFDGSVTRTGVMDFVATNADGITVADSSAFNGPTGTISFWMQSAGTDPNAPGDIGASVVCRTNTGSGSDFILLQTDSGPLEFSSPGPSGSANQFYSSKSISNNKWHLVTLTFDQSATGGAAIYIDGALDTTNANSGAWTWPTGSPLQIGYSSDTFWRDYNGLLDDVRYYNTILSASQIAAIYSSGALENTNALQMELNFTAPPTTGIVLTWKEGTAILQSAPSLLGPWTSLPGVSSPYTIVPAATQQFFRYKYVPQSLVSNPYLM